MRTVFLLPSLRSCFLKCLTIALFFLFSFIIYIECNDCLASGGLPLTDLSTGIAFPSNNSSVVENPATLANFQNSIFDLSTPVDSGSFPMPLGSFSSGLGNFGYGIDLERIPNDFAFTGAFAASTGGFSIGMNAERTLFNSSPSFALGLRQELPSYTIALVLKDLSNLFGYWIAGIGIPIGKEQRLGIDFDFVNSAGTGPGITSAALVGSWLFYMTQKFAFQVRYKIRIVPTLMSDLSDLGFGANLWVAQKTSVYGLYHQNNNSQTESGTTVGLKFLF